MVSTSAVANTKRKRESGPFILNVCLRIFAFSTCGTVAPEHVSFDVLQRTNAACSQSFDP